MRGTVSNFHRYDGLAGKGGRGYFKDFETEYFFVSNLAYASISIAKTEDGYYAASELTLFDCGYCSPVTNYDPPVKTKDEARNTMINEILARIDRYISFGHRLSLAERRLIEVLRKNQSGQLLLF